MANGVTYGINFPFRDSRRGDYLELTQLADQQVKSDLIHLLLTRKGSRYYLPNFGTRLYEFLFEPFDGLTFDAIQSDIRDAVQTFMPNLLLNQITITPADPEEEVDSMIGENTLGTSESPIYRLPAKRTSEYTAKIRIDYSDNRSSFAQSDFVIINI
jgi:phage baseplate assembly protein W